MRSCRGTDPHGESAHRRRTGHAPSHHASTRALRPSMGEDSQGGPHHRGPGGRRQGRHTPRGRGLHLPTGCGCRMTHPELLTCFHLIFTVDRIETGWVVVEWWGTTATTDVDPFFREQAGRRRAMGRAPEENHRETGSVDPHSRTYRSARGSLVLPPEHPASALHTTDIRMSRIPDFNSIGGNQS